MSLLTLLINLYHTLIQPYFYYYNINWCSDCTNFLENHFRKQKKDVRIIINSKWNVHNTESVIRKLNLLTAHNINKLEMYCFIHKIVRKFIPSYFYIFYIKIQTYTAMKLDWHLIFIVVSVKPNKEL